MLVAVKTVEGAVSGKLFEGPDSKGADRKEHDQKGNIEKEV